MLKIKSSVKKTEYGLHDLEQIKKELCQYQYVLLIKTDKVELVSASSEYDLVNLTELRAFDREKELHLVKSANGFFGRLRLDNDGEDCEVYDERQLLWGNAVGTENGITTFFEDRGISLKLPIAADAGERAVLEVRSYLSNEKFEFTDFRMVDVKAQEVKEYGI